MSGREWNVALGAAASETLWPLPADAPRGAVLDSIWWPAVSYFASTGLARTGAAPPEVWCDVPPDVARARVLARHSERHPIHGQATTDAEWEAHVTRGGPLALGPALRVDSTTPLDVAAVARWVADAS